MGSGFTISNMASLEVNTAMSLGNAQASSMGLGQKSANALSITNMIGQEDDSGGMIKTLMQSGSKNRLRGSGLKKDLMSIGKAAIGGGLGKSLDLMGADDGGSIISLKI